MSETTDVGGGTVDKRVACVEGTGQDGGSAPPDSSSCASCLQSRQDVEQARQHEELVIAGWKRRELEAMSAQERLQDRYDALETELEQARQARDEAVNTWAEAYDQGLRDARRHGPGVLQAVLDAIGGTLDTSTQIADHPNVKFALMQRHKLEATADRQGAALQTLARAYRLLAEHANYEEIPTDVQTVLDSLKEGK